MRLLVALQQMMMRSVLVYFSIVRRRPAWASRERLPPSWMTTTGGESTSRHGMWCVRVSRAHYAVIERARAYP